MKKKDKEREVDLEAYMRQIIPDERKRFGEFIMRELSKYEHPKIRMALPSLYLTEVFRYMGIMCCANNIDARSAITYVYEEIKNSGLLDSIFSLGEVIKPGSDEKEIYKALLDL